MYVKPILEKIWAMKAMKYAETHMKVHCIFIIGMPKCFNISGINGILLKIHIDGGQDYVVLYIL